jgi:hypothetical protein
MRLLTTSPLGQSTPRGLIAILCARLMTAYLVSLTLGDALILELDPANRSNTEESRLAVLQREWRLPELAVARVGMAPIRG